MAQILTERYRDRLLKKTIRSLIDLREILLGYNRRYLEFLSAMDDTSGGERDLVRLTEPQHDADRNHQGN